MGKTVVVIGGGGRESALVKKYSESTKVSKLIAIPGNDLMSDISYKTVKIFPKISSTDIPSIVNICKKQKADLIDVAQDDAVEAGVVDSLLDEGFKVFGPNKKAGQIEWDKAWSRDFMKKYDLPIPEYKVFNGSKKAIEFIKKNQNKKWFIKASGLAAGKGAIPASNFEEAVSAVKSMKKFGDAGETFVIEEWLSGEEFSLFAVCDGNTFKIIGYAQDHKRLFNGDLGPNTGGVGAVSNPLIVNRNIYSQANKIIKKTIEGMRLEGRPYKGILYLGGIVVSGKVLIIEFNARWGDPEAQVLVPALETDLYRLAISVYEEKLNELNIKIDKRIRMVVAGSLRSDLKEKEREIFGLEKILETNEVSFYGTRIYKKRKKYMVGSGRLFYLVAGGKDIVEVRKKIYKAMSTIFIEDNGLHFRTDIGWRDVARLNHK